MNKNPRDIMLDKGISPSVTRTKIYAYLDDDCHHPTVDEIHQALIDELPTLSKTTVYNTLRLFIEHGLAKPVTTSTTESRYELVDAPHSHFRCVTCGKIYDIPYIKTEYQHNALKDFLVTDEEVSLSGVCPACRKQH
jgi:Fe2+ or Zn2+ uptake regulation protein